MNRRKFLSQTATGSLALSLLPYGLSAQTETEYSMDELMGLVDIPLFGKKEDVQLREEAYTAFAAMKKAAYSAGFDLKSVSSYRNYYRQEGIWERKYQLYTEGEGMDPMAAIDKIIEYSTIPGTSRHHWGTDIDIIDGYPKVSGDVLVPGKFEGDGPYAPFKKWLDENANSFGFYLVYTNNPKRRGFKYEPWHYSFAKLSIPMLTSFRKKNILKALHKSELMGSEHFTEGFIQTYIQDNILDINPTLL